MPQLEDEYSLSKEFGIVRWRPEVIQQPERVLENFVAAKGQISANVFDIDGVPVSLLSKRDYTVLWLNLPSLKIKTTFELKDGALVPRFVDNKTLLRCECVWTPPPTLRLSFAIRMTMDRRVEVGFLWATLPIPNGFWKLPLTNTFDDCKMCLGERFDRLVGSPPKRTHQETLEAVLTILDEAPWNADLIDQFPIASCHALFRFDPATLKNLLVPALWSQYCNRASHPILSEIMP